MKNLAILFIAGTLGISSAFAQERPVRVGLKFGKSNIAGLNLEYATSFKLAPTADFSTISFILGDADLNYNYLELGSNYYFKEEAKGFYGHLSYGRVGIKGSYTDQNLGKGEGKKALNLANFKVGAKIGDNFYFRPEIGYGVLLDTPNLEVKYTDPTDGSRQMEEKEIPRAFVGGLLFNLGFGVAF